RGGYDRRWRQGRRRGQARQEVIDGAPWLEIRKITGVAQFVVVEEGVRDVGVWRLLMMLPAWKCGRSLASRSSASSASWVSLSWSASLASRSSWASWASGASGASG